MKTRCKFQVQKLTEFAVPNGLVRQQEVVLTAVHGVEKEEDVSFSQYTPSGELRISITNPAVIDKFKPGAFYFVDIIPAE